MYELIKASDSAYYFNSPAKIGLVKIGDGEVCLIDSGNDKSAANKVIAELNKENLRLSAVYNTHAHADHIGGNKSLQDKLLCKIYANGIECDMARHPIFEPISLFGAYPPTELKHKFLLAQPSNVESLTDNVLPRNISRIYLFGHSPEMVGFKTEDGVVYLADAVSSKETLDKYKVAYIYDVASYIKTLEYVKTLNAALFIPSHAEPTDNILPLVDYNLKTVYEIGETVHKFLSEPLTFDVILQKLFNHYSLSMTFEQHALVGSTLRSYLVWLKETNMAVSEIHNNMIFWRAT